MIRLQQSSTAPSQWTLELGTARALYANGDYDDVLRIVNPIIPRDDVDPVTKFGACQLKACVQSQRQEWLESLETLAVSASLVDDMSLGLRAKFFGQRALAHRNLQQVDNALVDYEAAREAAIAAGDEQTIASIKNNIAMVLSDAKRSDEALIEVDGAIRIATRLQDDVNLGRYYDTRAQILITAKRHIEALAFSKKAVALLASHPAGAEARTTHGLAMIGVGAGYLEEPKSVESFRARHAAAKMIDVELNPDLIRAALTRAQGHVLGAAKLLSVSHSVLIKLIDKHQLVRVPKRNRSKTLSTK